MKCPVCGSENKSTLRSCYLCGAPLPTDTAATPPHAAPGSAAAIWDAPKSSPQSATEAPTQPLYLDDEAHGVYNDPDLARTNVLPPTTQRLARHQSGDRVQVVLPPRPAATPGKKRARTQVHWGRFLTMSLSVLIILSAAVYGAVRAVQAILDTTTTRMAQSREAEELAGVPLVEKVLQDGREWHRITFYGENDEIVLVENPQRTLVIQDGKAELLLDDAGFIPDDLSDSDESITVQLTAFLFDKEGQERKILVEPYEIMVPLSPLKLINPQDTYITTDTNRITVKIKVTPGSRVLIGSQNVTDKIDSKGYVSATVEINPIGLNNVPISVETPLHRINHFQLQVDRPIMAVPITLDEVVSETSDGAITIRGGTDPGVVISTTATLEGEIASDLQEGTFAMKVLLTQYGWNDICLTATSPDGKTATLTQRVRRIAELESYSRKAWVVEYDYLASSANLLKGRIFAFEGTVIRDMEDANGDFLLFNIGEESDTQLVVIENDTGHELTVGKRYKLYADVMGYYRDYAHLVARFRYNRTTEPTPAPTATPAAS